MLHHRAVTALLFALTITAPSAVAAQHLILPAADEKPETRQPTSASQSQTPSVSAGQQGAGRKPGKIAGISKRFLSDEKAIWTSPLQTRRDQFKWILPVSAITGLMLATDNRAGTALAHSQDLAEDSREVSSLASGFATFGAAGTIYTFGKLTHNDRATETGMLGVEALVHSSIVVNVLKMVAGRERPNKPQGDGSFWEGGKSFPSGHAATIWALSTVIAEEYSDKPLIRFGAYGVAVAASAARITGRNHFPSDVLVGSTLGYLIGHYIVKRHHRLRVPEGSSAEQLSPKQTSRSSDCSSSPHR